ncbi:MAG: hypothetical protein IT384_15065 [Deltaproteobacteria bacterium]|nr:hypothetical protein [Deltaproteobacteria bacterium]
MSNNINVSVTGSDGVGGVDQGGSNPLTSLMEALSPAKVIGALTELIKAIGNLSG